MVVVECVPAIADVEQRLDRVDDPETGAGVDADRDPIAGSDVTTVVDTVMAVSSTRTSRSNPARPGSGRRRWAACAQAAQPADHSVFV
ncbi:hypothetical protein [Dactylosporangium sp. NPDC049140]|uniref:hypothetical protein n=1 Tax=Dactylosporangium sp. NPDC049140 TaxID=3155647 RepID=UPI00340A3785